MRIGTIVKLASYFNLTLDELVFEDLSKKEKSRQCCPLLNGRLARNHLPVYFYAGDYPNSCHD